MMAIFLKRTKQEKMGVELERLNADHTMESREDCQELVCISTLEICDVIVLILFSISVLHGERADRQATLDQKANA